MAVAAPRRLGQFLKLCRALAIPAPGTAIRRSTTPNQARHHAICGSSCLGSFLEIPSRCSKCRGTSGEAKQATQAKGEVAMTLPKVMAESSHRLGELQVYTSRWEYILASCSRHQEQKLFSHKFEKQHTQVLINTIQLRASLNCNNFAPKAPTLAIYNIYNF